VENNNEGGSGAREAFYFFFFWGKSKPKSSIPENIFYEIATNKKDVSLLDLRQGGDN